jgi:hypothetical protein
MPAWLRRLLASDSVRDYVRPYYIPFLIWGVYGSFYAYPIQIIVDVVGRDGYDLWVWAPIPATIVAMTGLALRHGGSPAEQIGGGMLKRDYVGLYMQIGGHLCMHIVLWVYVITGFIGSTWGQPVISVILLTAYIFGTGLLAAQCCYKVHRGHQLQRRNDG